MFNSKLKFLFVMFFAVIIICPSMVIAQSNEVEFDNKSGQIALVKLIGPTTKDVNVPINSKLSVTALPGEYYIMVRYGTPDNYQYTKGEKFKVTETTTKRSRTTITLHKVIGGNYDAKPISENEFTVSTPSISKENNKSFSKKTTEKSWVESTDVNFDGEVGFFQDTMGSMNDLIAKYKKGEKGVKIYANGKIVAHSGKVLAVFNDTPAKIVSIGDSEYYQFDEGDWRFRSSINRFEKYRKVFHKEGVKNISVIDKSQDLSYVPADSMSQTWKLINSEILPDLNGNPPAPGKKLLKLYFDSGGSVLKMSFKDQNGAKLFLFQTLMTSKHAAAVIEIDESTTNAVIYTLSK
ncbi:hypothetical protein KA005_70655 [bacterium]|nr:hypothetical protein [bacterium]